MHTEMYNIYINRPRSTVKCQIIYCRNILQQFHSSYNVYVSKKVEGKAAITDEITGVPQLLGMHGLGLPPKSMHVCAQAVYLYIMIC